MPAVTHNIQLSQHWLGIGHEIGWLLCGHLVALLVVSRQAKHTLITLNHTNMSSPRDVCNAWFLPGGCPGRVFMKEELAMAYL